MAKRILTVDSWKGGASHDPKDGVQSGFKRSRSIDVRRRSSSIILQKRTVKESGSTVTTPVTDMVRVPNKRLFMMGDSKIYQRNPEAAGGIGTYSTLTTTGVTGGMQSGVYMLDKDRVFIPGSDRIHWITTPQGTPAFVKDGVTYVKDKAVVNTGSNTYSAPTTAPSANESATHILSWIPEVEPLIQIGLWVVAKGTSDLYFEVHDATNAVVASGTIPNASLSNGAMNYLVLAAQVRQYVGNAAGNGRTYHLHIRATGTTTTPTTVRVATASNFSTADIETRAAPLVSGVYHPSMQFLQYLLVGNERYVLAWEPITDSPLKTEIKPHRLVLPEGYRVIGFSQMNEYAVISAVKSVSTDYGGDFGVNGTEGVILFWDGAQKNPNVIKYVKAGAFESPTEHGGVVYGLINGILHVTTGDIPIPVFSMPGVDSFTSANGHDDDVYLQAPYKGMAVDRNVLQVGFPYKSVNDAITPGVYGFGTRNKDYPESFTLDHVPSHGDLTIGYDNSSPKLPLSGITFVGNFGANLFIAWQRGSGGTQSFGVDVVRRNHAPYATGDLDLLDFDMGLPHHEKDVFEIGVVYKGTLPTGTTVVPRYRINHESSYQYGTADQLQHDLANKTIRLMVEKRFLSLEAGIEIQGNSNGSPEVLSQYIIIDDNLEEQEGD